MGLSDLKNVCKKKGLVQPEKSCTLVLFKSTEAPSTGAKCLSDADRQKHQQHCRYDQAEQFRHCHAHSHAYTSLFGCADHLHEARFAHCALIVAFCHQGPQVCDSQFLPAFRSSKLLFNFLLLAV
jgi:hypothetical protein